MRSGPSCRPKHAIPIKKNAASWKNYRICGLLPFQTGPFAPSRSCGGMWERASSIPDWIEALARYGFSSDAVLSMLRSVINGHGSMAQFSHPEFGGTANSRSMTAGNVKKVWPIRSNVVEGRFSTRAEPLVRVSRIDTAGRRENNRLIRRLAKSRPYAVALRSFVAGARKLRAYLLVGSTSTAREPSIARVLAWRLSVYRLSECQPER
jgi:hypothetical protein